MSMSNVGIKFEFNGETWKYEGNAAWHFVSLPKDITLEIRENLKNLEEGWGRIKATAKVGQSEWKTAIWYDSKLNTYLLPIKALIRKKESVKIGETIGVSIWI
jgi:hypothetical protein